MDGRIFISVSTTPRLGNPLKICTSQTVSLGFVTAPILPCMGWPFDVSPFSCDSTQTRWHVFAIKKPQSLNSYRETHVQAAGRVDDSPHRLIVRAM